MLTLCSDLELSLQIRLCAHLSIGGTTLALYIYVFSLCRHPIMLNFYYMCSLGFIFNGLSTALSDMIVLIYYLIRFDKILTV